MFEPVPTQVSFPELEANVLDFWKRDEIFARSLTQRRGDAEFVFYDGPPFATGLPHYGHLLAGTIKDVIPRYQTMCGRYVERTFGWDCHGLPVENEMEKQLGIGSKHEIESYGVAAFNEACRGIVLRYTKEWREIVERIGRWVDFDHGYRTMDRDYMESIWWVFRQLWDRGLVYEGHKILPYCPRCATPLSNFEANQGYTDVQDPSITVRFQSAEDPALKFLAWTTTPWTLPSNMALAVHPDTEYVRVTDGDEVLVLAAARVPVYYPETEPRILDRLPGRALLGQRYVPLFPYFADRRDQGAFRIVAADFVTTAEGTGIVHMAPGFGEDDAAVARAEELPVVCPLDAECRFTDEVPDFVGRAVKETDRDWIRRLKQAGQLVHQSTYQHSYPHCWRCDAPLIYRAVSTWFVRVEAIKDDVLRANADTNWLPAHLRDGRFGNWLENAHDWAISRNRYWGCPLPLWRSEDGAETVCIGSVAELESLANRRVEDIHKHFVDEIMIPSAQGSGSLRRVPEVLDCWFESGSMPYAQHHYPFENKDHFEAHFPADFIAEGLDQTRGWFYTLMVISAALFRKPPFRNVIVNGLVLAEDGRKMSKRLRNYPDPLKIMDTYGADALRLCLLSSPVVRAEDLRFSEQAVRDIMRSVILPVWNAYSFLATYATVDGWRPAGAAAAPPAAPANPLDQWILSRLADTVAGVRQNMDEYALQRAATVFTALIEDLNNWYIRRSRRRFWKSEGDADKREAYQTLHFVLITFVQLGAPLIPFLTETIYRNLRTPDMPDSVHLCDFPQPQRQYCNELLDRRMQKTITAVSLGRFLRSQAGLRTRQPLRAALLVSAGATTRADLEAMREVIADELNVKAIHVRADEEELVELSVKANYKRLGPRLGAAMPAAAKRIAALDADAIRTLRRGETLEVKLTGAETLALTAEDVTVHRQERDGLTVANDSDVTVALETRLDEDLIQEGWAREIVSRIQNLRKDAGLDVTDRIRVRVQLPPAAAAAVARFPDYICTETLALALDTAALPDTDPIDINGEPCRFELERAATRL